MRKLTPITDDPISFINSVINGTKKRKDDENCDEGHKFKDRCNAQVSAHKNYIENTKQSLIRILWKTL